MVTFKDYFEVIKNNKAIQMLVVSASTDKLGSAARTSTVTLIMYAIVVGNCEIIDAKIKVEIPLPIPCSVINSPIHIKITEPVVIAVTDKIQSPIDGVNSVAIFAEIVV